MHNREVQASERGIAAAMEVKPRCVASAPVVSHSGRPTTRKGVGCEESRIICRFCPTTHRLLDERIWTGTHSSRLCVLTLQKTSERGAGILTLRNGLSHFVSYVLMWHALGTLSALASTMTDPVSKIQSDLAGKGEKAAKEIRNRLGVRHLAAHFDLSGCVMKGPGSSGRELEFGSANCGSNRQMNSGNEHGDDNPAHSKSAGALMVHLNNYRMLEKELADDRQPVDLEFRKVVGGVVRTHTWDRKFDWATGAFIGDCQTFVSSAHPFLDDKTGEYISGGISVQTRAGGSIFERFSWNELEGRVYFGLRTGFLNNSNVNSDWMVISIPKGRAPDCRPLNWGVICREADFQSMGFALISYHQDRWKEGLLLESAVLPLSTDKGQVDVEELSNDGYDVEDTYWFSGDTLAGSSGGPLARIRTSSHGGVGSGDNGSIAVYGLNVGAAGIPGIGGEGASEWETFLSPEESRISPNFGILYREGSELVRVLTELLGPPGKPCLSE